MEVKFRKGDFSSNLSQKTEDGYIVFDNNTRRIYVGKETVDNQQVPIMFGSKVQNALWNSQTHVLTISLVNGDTLSVNLSQTNENGLLYSLAQAVLENKNSIDIINGFGTGSFQKAISDAVSQLDSNAQIASINSGVVTIKAGVTEQDGIIGNSTSSDITLHKIASTGSPSDMNVTYSGSLYDLQSAISKIKTDIDNAANAGTDYIVCGDNSSEIPSGFTYYQGNNGSLAASSSTTGKVYLVKDSASSYRQVITTSSNGSYEWTDLGSTQMDISGLVKQIILNGKTYDAASGNQVNIGQIVNYVQGQSGISNSNTDYVHVISEETTSEGIKTSSLSAQVKIGEVSTGGDGLAKASEVKNYVDRLVLFRNYTESDIPNN